MQEYDVVVVGAGAVGSAAAYRAASEGKRVLLLEQFRVGHVRGSSHGESRIIRHSYTSPAYASLAPPAFAMWRELERESGRDFLTMTGGIDVGRRTNPAMLACKAALDEAGFGSIWLEGDEATHAFPQFNLKPDQAVLWQSGAGILHAERAVKALLETAVAHSATLVEEAQVTAVEPNSTGAVVRYRMSGGEMQVQAANVVIAAGPWAGRFFAQLELATALRVTHQQVAYYPVIEAALWAIGRCPIYIVHGRNGFYGFPVAERPGFIKVAVETEIDIADADELPREPEAETLRQLNALVAERFRGVHPQPAEVVTCRYTETADRDFIIDRHPDFPQVVLASPCSGHGFKFSILSGRLAADLALSAAPPEELENWRPQFALLKADDAGARLAREWRD